MKSLAAEPAKKLAFCSQIYSAAQREQISGYGAFGSRLDVGLPTAAS